MWTHKGQEFLEEHKQFINVCLEHSSLIDADNEDEHKNCELEGNHIVLIQDLGNWAWEQFLEFKNIADKSLKEEGKGFHPIYAIKFQISEEYKKIAISCLGRKEIEKRLKELK